VDQGIIAAAAPTPLIGCGPAATVCCLIIYPAGQQPPEQRQAAHEATCRWLCSQPLLAASLTSSTQQQAIEAALSTAAAAANADTRDAMQLDAAEVKSEEGEAAAAADEVVAGVGGSSSEQQAGFGAVLMQLKRDMLRVEALLADTLKVRLARSQVSCNCNVLRHQNSRRPCLVS
jgi:hypothetical protein